MGLLIEDARGKGSSAGVTGENRLMTESVTQTQEHHSNQAEGEAYHVLFQVADPELSSSCILYIANESTEDLVIEGFTYQWAEDGYIEVVLGDQGTRNAASELTPANCNAGSGKRAVGTFESGSNLNGGSATLSGGTITDRIYIDSTTKTESYNFENDIIITQNQTFCLYVTVTNASSGTTGNSINGTLIMYYHDEL